MASQDNLSDMVQKASTVQEINGKKLRQQNIQLRRQIFELQEQLNEVLARKEAKKIKNLQLQNQLTSLYGEQINEQQNKIKRLKQQVYYLKSSNAKMNVEYINMQESQLLLMIKVRDQLLRQKELFKNKIQDKNTVLDKNNGLDSYKKNLEKQYTQTKRTNQKHSSQIVELSRQVRKYHLIAQTIKAQSNKKEEILDIGKLQSEFQLMVNQISKAQRQIKEIQEKWKPTILALDSQYFAISAEAKDQKQKLQKLQKQLKIYQHRSKSLRDQEEILSARNRLAKVSTISSSAGFPQTISSLKKQETNFQSIESINKEKIKSEFILKQIETIKSKRKNEEIIQKKQIISEKDKTIQKQNGISSERPNIVFHRSATDKEISFKQKEKKLNNLKISIGKQSQLKITDKNKQQVIQKSIQMKRSQSESNTEPKSKKEVSFILKDLKVKSNQRQNFKEKNSKEEMLEQSQKGPYKIKSQIQRKQVQIQKLLEKSSKENTKQSNKILKRGGIQGNEVQKSLSKKKPNLQKILKQQETIDSKTDSKSNIEEKYANKTKLNQNALKQRKIQQKIHLATTSQKHNPQKSKQNLKHLLKPQLSEKKKKKEKELRQQIKIQQKPVEQKKSNQIIKTIPKQDLQPKPIIQQKTVEKIQVKLENRPSIQTKSKNQDQKLIQKKSLDSQLQNTSPIQVLDLHNNDIDFKLSNNQNQELKNEKQEEIFKPYFIKRKRPGGSLNFSNRQESKQKESLLKMIEKQSIGVGNQEKS